MPAKAEIKKARPGSRGNLTIGFGLVQVPVSIQPLVSERRAPSAKTLCGEHHEPVKIAWRCDQAGGHIADETEKGYPHPDGEGYVILDDQVLEELVAERTKRVEIGQVVPVGEIDAVYLSKTYLVWPQDGADRAFDLFATALRDTGSAAVGTAVLSKQTQLLVLRWSEPVGCLVAHVCHFDEAIRWSEVAVARDLHGEIDKGELEQAQMLLSALTGEFDPRQVEDSYTAALDEAILVAAGARKPRPKAAKKAEPVGGDLMSALQASVAEASKRKKVPA